MHIPALAVTSFALAVAARAPASWSMAVGPARTEASPGEEEDPQTRAAELYRRGRASFETSDYDKAIELWTEAYAILDPTPENQAIRNDIVYNIASAQIEAFQIDGDVKHLKQARQLLTRYIQVYVDLYGRRGEDKELARVDAKLAEVEAQIRGFEKRSGTGDVRPADGTAKPRREAPDHRPRPERPRSELPARAKALLGAGAAVTAAGLGGLGLMTAGLLLGQRANEDFETQFDARPEAEARGRRANAMAVAGGIVGGVLVAGGVILVSLGAKEARRPARVAFGPGAGGGGLRLRF